jgi:hypothetical protein
MKWLFVGSSNSLVGVRKYVSNRGRPTRGIGMSVSDYTEVEMCLWPRRGATFDIYLWFKDRRRAEELMSILQGVGERRVNNNHSVPDAFVTMNRPQQASRPSGVGFAPMVPDPMMMEPRATLGPVHASTRPNTGTPALLPAFGHAADPNTNGVLLEIRALVTELYRAQFGLARQVEGVQTEVRRMAESQAAQLDRHYSLITGELRNTGKEIRQGQKSTEEGMERMEDNLLSLVQEVAEDFCDPRDPSFPLVDPPDAEDLALSCPMEQARPVVTTPRNSRRAREKAYREGSREPVS